MRRLAKCPACAHGPIGVQGHLGLFVLKMLGNRMQFHCRTCSSLWVRTTIDSNHRWSESMQELDALAVPGRNAEPPRGPDRLGKGR
jgi:hypothetical protein